MKKVILLVWLMPVMAYGQIVENFEQSGLKDWHQSVQDRWKADTSESLSGRYSLHHVFDNSDAGTDQAGILTDSLHPAEGVVKWSFLIRHGYDPSSSNNWSVFLMSDTDPSVSYSDGSTSGFAIGVNLTGYDDTLRLWKVKGNAITTVVATRINWQSDIGITSAVKIVIERSPAGIWKVTVSGSNGTLIGTTSGTDNELFPANWFIITYKYSSSRDRLLWFDDLFIDGVFYVSNEIPSITECAVSAPDRIKITLSGQPDDSFTSLSNFTLNPSGKAPVSVLRESSSVFTVIFADQFISRSSYTLTIKKICNRSGSCNSDTPVSFLPAWPSRGDIIISEIMADPEPVVSLPPGEYLELTNRTNYSFNLKGWKLSSGGTDYPLPELSFGPGQIMIVCPIRDTLEFIKYGKVIGLKQFPALTDDGRILLLYDDLGSLVHGVEYSSDWYGDELRAKGGWSLEMIDKQFPFFYAGNWRASSSREGGTPGRINALAENNPDLSFSGGLNVFPYDSMHISISSHEPLFTLPGMGDSIKIEEKPPVEISCTDPLFREFSLTLDDPLKHRKVYSMDVTGKIVDFAGNRLMKDKFSFGLAEPAAAGDILFNEILFNPLPGDPDYIELYNTSEKILDASRLEIVTVNDDSGDTSLISMVSAEHRCILPGAFYAFSTDIGKVAERYSSADPDNLFEAGSFPSMPDDKGHLILFSRELLKIDELSYSDKMQSPLLSGHEGVSLEKVGPGLESGTPGNWHSASESSGWGTPGAPNSVFNDSPPSSDMVELSSSRITPDEDGIEDLLLINFKLTGNTNVVSVTVFDENGNYVRKIAENLYAGAEATLTWDGIADDGSAVSTGVYIVFISMYDESGKTHRWKKVCTVIHR